MPTIRKKNLRLFAILILAAIPGGIAMQSDAFAADRGERTMTIVRIYTGADNQSHFEDVQIPLKSTGKIGFISELMKATGIVFRETGGDYQYDPPTPPPPPDVAKPAGEGGIGARHGPKRLLRSG